MRKFKEYLELNDKMAEARKGGEKSCTEWNPKWWGLVGELMMEITDAVKDPANRAVVLRDNLDEQGNLRVNNAGDLQELITTATILSGILDKKVALEDIQKNIDKDKEREAKISEMLLVLKREKDNNNQNED